MSDLINSDSTSTYESLHTETTLIINASKCLICDKLLGYQGRFTTINKCHKSCMEDKRCLFCGCNGLNTLCSQNECQNVFHLFCYQRYNKKTDLEEPKCPIHQDSKKEKPQIAFWAFRKIANNIQTDENKLINYKENRGEIKAVYMSHGQIFWSIIGCQYFPNVKLSQHPVLYAKPLKDQKKKKEKSWVSNTIKTLSKEYKQWKNSNLKIFKDGCLNREGVKLEKAKHSEKEAFLFECSSAHFSKSVRKETLSFLEKNTKPDVPDAEDDICDVCHEYDYDEGDEIYKCKSCSVKAHIQCYGINTDKNDWQCESCRSSYEFKDFCALCPVVGGVLKPTVNLKNSQFDYLPIPNNSPMWVHIFCATHINPACIKNKMKVENIDLLSIDKKMFSEKCSLCDGNKGACVKCVHARCRVYFHPGCAKELFLYTRNHSGSDVTGPYCEAHKTSRIRKVLEIKESQLMSDFNDFIRIYEKIDKVSVAEVPDSEFSSVEKYKIFKSVDRFLEQNRKFEIVFKYNRLDNKSLRNNVEDCVGGYTLLEPKSIVDEQFNTMYHEPLEVQEYYSKNIFELMKKELKILKLPAVTYRRPEDT